MSAASEEFDSAELEIIEREARDGRKLAPITSKVNWEETPDQRRNRLQREHHEAILAGKVDIGPITEHEHITVDIRDKRDPRALGLRLLVVEAASGSICNSADYLDSPSGRIEVVEYDPGETSVAETVRTRRAELEARAANGDKFAISMLTTGKPGDSDE